MPQKIQESPTSSDAAAGSAARASARPNLEALSAHYRAAYERHYRDALRIVKSPEVAAEVVHDAYANTLEKLNQGYEIKHMGGWFRTVIRNLALQALHNRESLPLPDDYMLRGSDSVVDIAASRQRCRDLYGAIGNLRPAQRSAFLLAELRGLNYSEIASDLGRSEDSIRSLLARARRQIRAAMESEIPALVAPLAKLEAALARWAERAREAADHLAGKLTELHSSVASLAQRAAALLSQPAEALAVALLTIGVLGAQLISPPAPAGLDGATSGPTAPVAGTPSAGGGAASPEAPTGRGKSGVEGTAPTAGTVPAPSADETAPKPGAEDGKAPSGGGEEQPPASGQGSSGSAEGASAPPSGGDYVFGDPPPAQDYNGPGFDEPGSEPPPAQSFFDPPPLLDPPEGSAPAQQLTRPHLGEPRSPRSEPVREAAARDERAEPDSATGRT